jgi:hypothetical protein
MAILTAEAKLYQSFRTTVVDKNITANLSSNFSIGNYNRPAQPSDQFEVYSGALAFKVKFYVCDMESASSVALVDERYLTYGGGNNVITPGSPRVVNNTNNAKLTFNLKCKFPTYVRVDLDALGLPEGTDIIVDFEEGFALEGNYPGSVAAPMPAIKNYTTFRTPWYGVGFLKSVATISSIIGSIKPFTSNISAAMNFAVQGKYSPADGVSIEVAQFSLNNKITYNPGNLEARFLPVTFFSSFGSNPIPGGFEYILTKETRVRFHDAVLTTSSEFILPEYEKIKNVECILTSSFNTTVDEQQFKGILQTNYEITSNMTTLADRIRNISPNLIVNSNIGVRYRTKGALRQTNRQWTSISSDTLGNIYATVNGGDIYVRSDGQGDFIALGQTTRPWSGVAVDPVTGDTYASTYYDSGITGSGKIYRRAFGTTNFLVTDSPTSNYYHIEFIADGTLYCASRGSNPAGPLGQPAPTNLSGRTIRRLTTGIWETSPGTDNNGNWSSLAVISGTFNATIYWSGGRNSDVRSAIYALNPEGTPNLTWTNPSAINNLTYNWQGLTVGPGEYFGVTTQNSLYAAVGGSNGYIVEALNTNQLIIIPDTTNNNWYDVTMTPTGELYACQLGGDIWIVKLLLG